MWAYLFIFACLMFNGLFSASPALICAAALFLIASEIHKKGD